MSNDLVGIQSIAVDGVWLRREGEYAVVLVEVDGKWVEVIRERDDGPFSHVVEPGWIKAKADGTSAVAGPTRAAAGVTPRGKIPPKGAA